MFTKILHRPAMAMVLSIILLFLGGLGIVTLPVSQFPDIAPPTVEVAIAYPGASAEVLVDSVLVPLEQSINGVQNMRYIVSDATSAGEGTIRIYFEPGTDPDIAVVNVQNRVNIVMNRLPPLVQREGILVSQVVPSMLMYVNLYSTNPGHDQKFLYNFANANVLPELKRINGMGRPRNLGNRAYAMRVWLNPDEMRKRNVSTEDVMKMIAEQSVIGSPGRLGQATGQLSQSTEYVLTYKGRYNEAKDYAQIILKETRDGKILRLEDVCGTPDPIKKQREGLRGVLGTAGVPPEPPPGVELGSEFFDIYSDVDGHPACSIMLKQSPGSNATKVIEEVKKKLDEMKKEKFPPGMDYKVSYDVSHFLDASIEKVVHTLIEAFILVSLVVYMFLGDVRSTLIPILAVPVSLIGTFFVLKLFGQSINLITLFAMVLAIGVVVDDAIVVVEAVHAKMAEKHLTPYLATREVLGEISGAIIAITLVMTAVFVPVTFIPGPVGAFYRSFGITMATSIILSGLVALTLTPVLCAMILKPHAHGGHDGHGEKVKKKFSIKGIVLAVIFGGLLLLAFNALIWYLWGPMGLLLNILPLVRKPFDWLVERVTSMFTGILRGIVTRRALTMLVIAGFTVGLVGVNTKLPTGFIPGEDQGIIYGIIQTPPGTTLEITNSKSHELKEVAKELEDVEDVTSLAGYEVLTEGRGSNAGTCIINLKDWNDRKLTARQIIEELEVKSKKIANVKVEFFEPPAVPGFGAAGGFSCRVLDQTNTTDYKRLGEVNDKFMAALYDRPELKNLFTFYTSDYPQFELLIDNDKAMQKGVTIGKALNELNILIGSTYEQGFVRFNQFYKVYVQAIPGARRNPEDLLGLSVKNESGEEVFFSAFMTLKKKQGLNEITRYNLYPSATIQGAPAKGYSTGQAIKAIQEEAKKLPPGYAIGWEGLSLDEAKRGIVIDVPKVGEVAEIPVAAGILAIVIIFVYLVLVAQYESFIIPFAVMLSLPVGLFGSFLFLQALGLANDVYAQIGLVMLVGLLGKNAILIVEFAVQRRNEGLSLKDAAIEGGKLRFRPIQMTSFAFIAGLLPLVIATGAGAIGNRTIGTTAAGGMLLGTVFGVIVIPGLYYLFGKLADGRKFLKDETDQPLSEMGGTAPPHAHETPPHGTPVHKPDPHVVPVHQVPTHGADPHDEVVPLTPHPPPPLPPIPRPHPGDGHQ